MSQDKNGISYHASQNSIKNVQNWNFLKVWLPFAYLTWDTPCRFLVLGQRDWPTADPKYLNAETAYLWFGTFSFKSVKKYKKA
jgi:hypothetical protein